SHNWNMVELIGTLVFDHTPGTGMTSKYNQIPQNIRSRLTDGTAKTMIPVLVARIIRDVQGMNMSLYQQVITLRRDFDHKFNEIMDNIEVKEMTIE
ncbi:16506_t:CDS:2, partial [Acaulospora morrowiae]